MRRNAQGSSRSCKGALVEASAGDYHFSYSHAYFLLCAATLWELALKCDQLRSGAQLCEQLLSTLEAGVAAIESRVIRAESGQRPALLRHLAGNSANQDRSVATLALYSLWKLASILETLPAADRGRPMALERRCRALRAPIQDYILAGDPRMVPDGRKRGLRTFQLVYMDGEQERSPYYYPGYLIAGLCRFGDRKQNDVAAHLEWTHGIPEGFKEWALHGYADDGWSFRPWYHLLYLARVIEILGVQLESFGDEALDQLRPALRELVSIVKARLQPEAYEQLPDGLSRIFFKMCVHTLLSLRHSAFGDLIGLPPSAATR